MEFKKQTEQLRDICDQALARFQKMRDENLEPDFFAEVKPYADDVRAQLTDWKENASHFVHAYAPKYFHTLQIDQVIDAMEQFVVQSFYQKTSKKRFTQSVQSVHYTLTRLIRTIEEAQMDER